MGLQAIAMGSPGPVLDPWPFVRSIRRNGLLIDCRTWHGRVQAIPGGTLLASARGDRYPVAILPSPQAA